MLLSINLHVRFICAIKHLLTYLLDAEVAFTKPVIQKREEQIKNRLTFHALGGGRGEKLQPHKTGHGDRGGTYTTLDVKQFGI